MQKTKQKIKDEICGLVDNYWPDIKSAYVAHEFDLKIAINVNLGVDAGKITVAPTIEFFPEPKKKSAKYTVKIDEKQLEMFE